jgi:hypothetical protein
MFARVCRPLGLILFGLGFILAWDSWGRCEEKQLINDSLKSEFNSATVKRRDLITGVHPPQDKEDQKVMEVMAKWYVQRVTLNAINRSNPAEMAKYHDELERELIGPLVNPNSNAPKGNKVFVDQLGKHLAASLKAVLVLDFDDNRSAILNAALMLPAIARLKQEEVGDLLVELMKDKDRHDIVKLYAAKAMREFFPAHLVVFADDPKNKEFQLKFKRDSERLQALVNFMKREGPPPADDGQREVTLYLRREAVISLARIGVPALSALKKNAVVEGPAAYELLRVLVKTGKDAYDPPPSLSERVEAAVGLCQLKDPGGDADYDPRMAIYAVGLCFLDYATEYANDYLKFSERYEKNPKGADTTKIPKMPWKIQSERFKQGAKEFVTDAPKGSTAQKNAQRLERDLSKIADSMKAYKPVTLDELIIFRKVVNELAPKTGQLYKLKGPQIDPASLQAGAADAQ